MITGNFNPNNCHTTQIMRSTILFQIKSLPGIAFLKKFIIPERRKSSKDLESCMTDLMTKLCKSFLMN